MGSGAVKRTSRRERDDGPRSLNDVLVRFADALGADVAAVLTPVDPDPTADHVLSVEALLARAPRSNGKGVDHLRGWNRGPFTVHWADRSLLGKALAAHHAILAEYSFEDDGDQPGTQLFVAAPVERTGIHLGVLYARCARPSEGEDRSRLGWTADTFAQEMVPLLIRRPPSLSNTSRPSNASAGGWRGTRGC